MPDLGEQLARQADKVPSVDQFTGRFVGFNADGMARVTVDLNDEPLTVRSINARPAPGARVILLRVNGVVFMLGESQMRSTSGVVTSITTIDLDSDGDPDFAYSVLLPSGESVAGLYALAGGATIEVGHRVKLLWQDEGIILGRIAGPAPTVSVIDKGDTIQPGAADFKADWAGTYQAGLGWWQDKPRASNSNVAAWGYGSKIRDTIPATATIQTVEIWLPQESGLYSLPPIGTHSIATGPAGAPAVETHGRLPGTTSWVPIPITIIEKLRDSDGGVAVPAANGATEGWDYTWKRLLDDTQSGTLRVSWR